jgi:hypothetical protein
VDEVWERERVLKRRVASRSVQSLPPLLSQPYIQEALERHEQELKAFDRRYKKAVKAGIVPMVDKSAKKSPATRVATKKKGTGKKRPTAVDKVLDALMKEDKLSGELSRVIT